MTTSPLKRSIAAHCAVLLMALSFAACGGPKDSGPTIANDRAAKGDIPAEFHGQVPALSDASILGFLPDSTVGAWFVRNPRELEASTEFSTIIREYKEFYSELLPQVTGPGGSNLLLPSTWPILGVDPDRPAGVALLVGRGAVGVFFVSLTNKELFKKSLDLLGTHTNIGPVVAASAGEATVYVFGGFNKIAIVVRGEVAMLVIPDRVSDLEEHVLAIAGTQAKATLASSDRIAKAFAGFDFGKDMAGFLAFDSLAATFLADQRRESMDLESQVEDLRQQIAEAKAANRSAERIARLEHFLQRLVQMVPEQTKSADAALALISEVLGSIGTVVVGVELDGKTTGLRAQFRPTPNSLPSRMTQEATRSFALPGQLQERPLFLLGAHINMDTANKIFDLFLQADGVTREFGSDELKSMTGVSLDEIVNSFDGELSGALTLAGASDAVLSSRQSNRSDDMGLHLMAHLGNVDSATAVFDKICSHRKLASFVVEHDGRKALEMPSFNSRKIRIYIRGEYLQAISIGSAGSPPNWTKSERRLLELPTSRLVMVLDPALLVQSLGSSDRRAYQYEPRRGEDQAARERAKPIREQLGALYSERSRLEDEAYGGKGDKVDRLVATGHSDRGRYAVKARFEGASKNLGRSIQAIFEAERPEIRFKRGGDATELNAIQAQIDKLEESLWRALMRP